MHYFIEKLKTVSGKGKLKLVSLGEDHSVCHLPVASKLYLLTTRSVSRKKQIC